LSNYKNLDSFLEHDVIEANKKTYYKTADLYEDVVFTEDAHKRLELLIGHAIKNLSNGYFIHIAYFKSKLFGYNY